MKADTLNIKAEIRQISPIDYDLLVSDGNFFARATLPRDLKEIRGYERLIIKRIEYYYD